MSKSLYPQALPPKTAQLIKVFQKTRPSFLKNFYLSGGTALSLQINHRQSIDLDFFSQRSFDPQAVQRELETLGKLTDLELDKNTLNAFLKGVQIQFLGYPYPLLKPTYNWEGINISSVLDIACTKLQTVSQRGSKKDFVDLYFILKKYSLKELFQKIDQKYSGTNSNKVHLLKSLTYFVDADLQPMPKMRQKTDWEKIKKVIVRKVINFKIQ